VQERGSHGWSGSVDPEGGARLGLSDSGPDTVVVVVDPPPWPATTVVVVVDEPGALVGGEALGARFTAKLEPVTTTMSALADPGNGEPTSIDELVVGDVPPPPSSEEPVPPTVRINPGS
jgi:hypothetical protein